MSKSPLFTARRNHCSIRLVTERWSSAILDVGKVAGDEGLTARGTGNEHPRPSRQSR